ncbi:hypothetical protein [Streptomyces sp. NBC_01190]|uniref:hypothetical protein n=1 Tax=Streptomyces sp. NBC_01190 TaxID=2903767 RepID=UPI00386554E8|nr:hypothetical protein OG519_14180 [Streptomyces sp. NBC_01190]
MTASLIDAAAWRHALPRQRNHRFDRVLVVQCSVDWLRPGQQALREEIDDFLLTLCAHRSDLRVDRLVLHSLPTAHAAPDGDLTALNAAHAEWMYGLSSASILLDHPALHIHRLIISGDQARAGVDDFIDMRRDGSWMTPELTVPVLELLSRARSTTPLSGYVDLQGPFADTDPSFYL